MSKALPFILIPGRTALREKALSEGSLQASFRHDANTLSMNADDMGRLGIVAGDVVRVRSSSGSCDLPCQVGEVPQGLLWIAHGDVSSGLLDDDTAASGMPTSKGIDVTVERIE